MKRCQLVDIGIQIYIEHSFLRNSAACEMANFSKSEEYLIEFQLRELRNYLKLA